MTQYDHTRPSSSDIECMIRMLEYLEAEFGRYHPLAAEITLTAKAAVQREQQEHLMALFNLRVD